MGVKLIIKTSSTAREGVSTWLKSMGWWRLFLPLYATSIHFTTLHSIPHSVHFHLLVVKKWNGHHLMTLQMNLLKSSCSEMAKMVNLILTFLGGKLPPIIIAVVLTEIVQDRMIKLMSPSFYYKFIRDFSFLFLFVLFYVSFALPFHWWQTFFSALS